jgi:hypothetical protein
MTQFESSVKMVPCSQQVVYNKISDLNNLEAVKDKLPASKINNFIFDVDSVSCDVSPVGTVCIRIIEREEPKFVKFETVKAPFPFNLWIQIVPVDDCSCKIKLTIKAELNVFIKGMVSKPLQEGLEKIADTLAMIPYGK